MSSVVVAALLLLIIAGAAAGGELFSPWACWPNSDSMGIGINRMLERYRSLDLERSDVTLNYVGSTLWTATLDFEIYGTTAFALNMNGLMILDVSDPADPVLQKKIPLGFCGPYNTSYLDGHYLYLGRSDRLHIFDVSDPLNPVEVSVTILQGWIMEIIVQDGRMYVGIGRYGGELDNYPALYIYDVTDPANPVSLGKYESPWSYKECRRFEIVGDYIYGVNVWNSRVDVIYIGDETSPVKVNHIEVLFPYDVIHDSGYLYIQKDAFHIMIYDISDLAMPILVDSIVGNRITAMEIRDSKLYAAAGLSLDSEIYGVAVYDIPTPGQLSYAGFYEARTRWYTMTFHDTLLYFPEPCYGYRILDVSDPLNISAVTVHSDDIFDLEGLDVKGSYAYVTNRVSQSGENRNGLYVVDITDKENPNLVSYDRPPLGGWNDACVYNDLMLLSGRSVRIYSLADPAYPTYLAHFPLDEHTTRACIARGNILYACVGGSGFQLGDISDPSDPQPLSIADIEDHITGGVILSDNIAYVASRWHRSDPYPDESCLQTVDISDPANAVILDTLSVALEEYLFYWPLMEITMRGDYIYYAGGSTGLSVINTSIPDDPEVVYHYQLPYEAFYDVAWKRNYLFALGQNSIQIFDLTHPDLPELIDFIPMTSEPRRLKIIDDYLYLSCRWGFYIFEMTLPPVDCGDANGDGSIDIDDVVYLIGYIFSSGPAPDPLEAGDADCSGGVDIDDVVYLIMYIFSGGHAPCDIDGDSTPDC